MDFEQIDSIYIAKLILDKLQFSYNQGNEANLLHPKEKQLLWVLSEIENIEADWELSTNNNFHTFWRKELNEVIKLWSIPKKSAEVLENLVILTWAKNILEIWTSAWYSTLHLASWVKFNDGKIYTIELLKEKIEMAKTNFQNSNMENIVLLEDEASKVLKNWKYWLVDFVFLDADKENYGKYFDLIMPILKVNGLIIADNINDYGHMMEDYLQKITWTHLPKSRVDKRVISYYLAALDNWLIITKKISN